MQKRRGKTKTKKRTSRPAKKQLSAVTIQNLRALAEQIGNIIPATSFRKGAFCFQNLAKKLGHQKDLADSRCKERNHLWVPESALPQPSQDVLQSFP
jgi:hypothetical protein